MYLSLVAWIYYFYNIEIDKGFGNAWLRMSLKVLARKYVGESMQETTGLIGQFSLWIFGR